MPGSFISLLIMLIIAVGLLWLFKRLGLPAILAYLLVGLSVGPFGLDLLANSASMHYVAELGIVFLLFSLGLEFSIPKLLAMRRLVFGVGSFQVVLTCGVFYLLLYVAGFDWLSSFTIACITSLSSTAVVAKLLSETGTMQKREGQIAIGVLLFQDIAVVPMLIALPLLANDSGAELIWQLSLALVKGAMVCGLLFAVGKWLLPKIFNEIAIVRTDELFVLTTLLVAICAGGLTYAFGLSMALGAFLAGMMLGESQYRHQLEADIRPFRDILMGLFFATVGMQLDIHYVISHSVNIIGALVLMLVAKGLILFCIAIGFKEKKRDALATGVMLCQMGEFGFVLVTIALKHQILSQEMGSFLIALGVLSMALTPYLIERATRFSQWLFEANSPEHTFNEEAHPPRGHVLICGYGRVGQTIARFLKAEAIDYLAVEIDPLLVAEAHAAGDKVLFGHARQRDILQSAGVKDAQLVIITIADYHQALVITDVVRQVAPNARVLVRMRDDTHLDELKAAGVTEVVPEALEASLMLVSHVLYMSGVPVKRIIKRVSQERENRYDYLHGFYPSDNEATSASEQARLEHLHAVALVDSAWAIGKDIATLNLSAKRVELFAIRRGDKEMNQWQDDFVLGPNDVVILRGRPRPVERAEHYLLKGP